MMADINKRYVDFVKTTNQTCMHQMPSSFYHHPNKDVPSCDSLIMYSSKNPAASNNAMTTAISIIVGLMSNFRLTRLKSTYAI